MDENCGNGHIICTPGQRICASSESHVGGEGTYTFNDYIYAAVAGKVTLTRSDNVIYVKVTRGSESSVMPSVGSIVTCRVLSVNPVQASVSILAVGENVLHNPFQGTVKKQNVRQHQIDTVEMYNCFRPGDIILARVLSLGGIRSYELSTALNEFGVVTAKCEEGHILVPASWTTMKCDCRIEKRKVAKVVPPKNTSVLAP